MDVVRSIDRRRFTMLFSKFRKRNSDLKIADLLIDFCCLNLVVVHPDFKETVVDTIMPFASSLK